MKKNPKLGFSLIELSVVILVIGILVIGITQGSRIIGNAKLTSARSLTKNSPVNSSNDVALWLETTSEASFSTAESANQSTVTNWFDIKRSAINDPFNLTQSNAVFKPKYIANAINGLPTIRFDGVDDFLLKTNVPGRTFTSQSNDQITIFAVHKYYTPIHQGSVISWYAGSSNRINITSIWDNGIFYFDFGNIMTGNGRMSFTPPATHHNKTNIITTVRRPSGTSAIRVNGTQYQTSALNAVLNTSQTTDFYIAAAGGTGPFGHCDISEIIIFKTALKDSEIKAIEQYLGTKWGIALKGL